MKKSSSSIQCKNVFRDGGNTAEKFNRLWAEIISDSEMFLHRDAPVDAKADLCYNEQVRSYPPLERKEVG